MAEDPSELTGRGDGAPGSHTNGDRRRTPAEIHHDIQRTRADIDRTLDTLRDELRPGKILWSARRRFEPEVRAAAVKARDGVRRQARENPAPLIAAGAAALGLLGFLTLRRRRRQRAFPTEQKGL